MKRNLDIGEMKRNLEIGGTKRSFDIGGLKRYLEIGGMKRYLKIGGIVLACILAVLIALPFFINVNSFRPKIESVATSTLGRSVKFGNLSLSILSGSIGVDNISIADDPSFSKSPFVTAKSLKVDIELMPLIFSRQLEVTGIVLEQPEIILMKGSNGTWNFSSIGSTGARQPAATENSSSPANLSVGKLEIKDGKITVAKVNSSSKPQVFDDVNLDVKDFAFSSRFPFELSATIAGGGKTNVSGEAGPINAADAAKTPFDASVKLDNLNIAAAGLLDPASGIDGMVTFDGKVNSDGSTAKTTGVATCEKVKLSPKGSPAPKPVSIKYAMNVDLARESGTITQGDISIGKAIAHLAGTFQSQGDMQILNLNLNASDMSVDELEAMLPALGIVLPSGSQLKGGTLAAQLAISGSPAKTVITGPVRLSNTKLAGFDLGSKLGALSAFTGKTASNGDTTIQNASLNARVAPEGTHADSINLAIPAIGVIIGNGTISPAGALDFHMSADLHGGMAGGLTQKAGLGGGSGSVAFTIQGTTSNPKFVPDVTGIATNVATKTVQNAVSGKAGGLGSVGGLLGGKKKQ